MTLEEKNKKLVLDFHHQVLQEGRLEALASFLSPHFIQRYPVIAPGAEGLRLYLESSGPWPHKIYRVLTDGDWVAVHYEAQSVVFPVCAAWGLYRVEAGKIAEYWQGQQVLPARSVSGRGLLDGSIEREELDRGESNKELVEDFYKAVIIDRNFPTIPNYFEGDDYLQHNPMLPDGVSGFTKTMQVMALTGMGISIPKMLLAIGEGNFVLIVAEGELVGKWYVTFDLFRVAKGKIKEHWDVMAEITPRKELWNE